MSLSKGYEKKHAELKVAENIKDKQTKFECVVIYCEREKILTVDVIVLQRNLTRDVLPLTYGRNVDCNLLCLFPFNHLPFTESKYKFPC